MASRSAVARQQMTQDKQTAKQTAKKPTQTGKNAFGLLHVEDVGGDDEYDTNSPPKRMQSETPPTVYDGLTTTVADGDDGKFVNPAQQKKDKEKKAQKKRQDEQQRLAEAQKRKDAEQAEADKFKKHRRDNNVNGFTVDYNCPNKGILVLHIIYLAICAGEDMTEDENDFLQSLKNMIRNCKDDSEVEFTKNKNGEKGSFPSHHIVYSPDGVTTYSVPSEADGHYRLYLHTLEGEPPCLKVLFNPNAKTDDDPYKRSVDAVERITNFFSTFRAEIVRDFFYADEDDDDEQ